MPDADRIRALIVEDDDGNRLLLRRFLEQEGYAVVEASDGPGALRAVREADPELVVLDLGLPGFDGFGVLAGLRRTSAVPVLVLTGRADEADKLRGLDAGADDYMVKPYSLPELAARLRALRRRGSAVPGPERIEVDGLLVDLGAVRVVADGTEVDLTPKEFDLLAFLARAPGRTFSKEELLAHVWGTVDDWQDPATVTEHVRRIRRKLGDDPDSPRWLETVRGRGYRLVPAPDTAAPPV